MQQSFYRGSRQHGCGLPFIVGQCPGGSADILSDAVPQRLVFDEQQLGRRWGRILIRAFGQRTPDYCDGVKSIHLLT
jgi:hypothetical protein